MSKKYSGILREPFYNTTTGNSVWRILHHTSMYGSNRILKLSFYINNVMTWLIIVDFLSSEQNKECWVYYYVCIIMLLNCTLLMYSTFYTCPNWTEILITLRKSTTFRKVYWSVPFVCLCVCLSVCLSRLLQATVLYRSRLFFYRRFGIPS